jgi:transcriptional regulator with XRE-family HTH domain
MCGLPHSHPRLPEVRPVISPYVRRSRLATELVRLREEHDYSADRLAKAIGVTRQRISRVENGHVRPDLDEIMRILDVLNVGQKRWDQIMTISREAQERGWWEKFADEMGPRQALYANLEAGARSINEYQMTLLPGLLQIPAFTEARARADRGAYTKQFDAARALEARAARQRMVGRPGGPTYEVIIDEIAIRRLAAPPPVVAAQLRHLVDVGRNRKKVTMRVLPLAAPIFGHAVPRSAFFTYRYPDPGDPVVVAVDTVTSDFVLKDLNEVSYYLTLYERLLDAALEPADSLDFLATVAQELPHETGKQP